MHILYVVIFLLLYSANSNAVQTEQVFKVGAVLPLSGSLASTGAIYKQAYTLVFDLINNLDANISYSPFTAYQDTTKAIPTFELTILDDESDHSKSAEQVTVLAEEYGVNGLLGGYRSDIVEAQAEQANKYGIPYVNGGGAASSIYTLDRAWVFGTMESVEDLGKSTMVMLKDLVFRGLLPKPTSLAIAVEQDDHGKDYYTGIRSFLNKTENGAYFDICASLSFPFSQNGSEDAVVKFAHDAYSSCTADVLLVDAHLDLFILIHKKLMSDLGHTKYKMISYGARGGEEEAVRALGKDVNGLFFGTWWSNRLDNQQSRNLKMIWGNSSSPDLPLDYRAGCAYETARALISAVIAAGDFAHESVRAALAKLYLKDSLFLNEQLRFNPYGQADYDFAFEQVFFSNQFTTKLIYPVTIKEEEATIYYYSPHIPERVNNSIGVWIGVGLGGLVLLIVIGIALILLSRRRKRVPDIEMQPSSPSSRYRAGYLKKKRKLSPGSRLVSQEDFPLVLSSWNIDLGLMGGQCPVDKVLSQTITMTNRSKHAIYYQFILPERTHKGEVFFNPMAGKIQRKQSIEVTINLQFFCTAKWVAQPLLSASKQKESTTRVHVPLDIKLDSMLSTKLSYDEVETHGPAIGEGSYGTVFKGEWRGLSVAVKKLKVQDGVTYPEGLLDELQREVEIMSTLRHPNIVNFIGASLVPGHLFLVTEFMPLGNLGQYLNPKNHIRVMLKVKIALDCARGMDFLHKCNILHRDLKPDNLLVVSMSRSAPTNVKLTDFGTARAVTLTITKATQMTVGLGTPIYMAPEVMQGDYDQKSDVFSFAILLYELCTQTTPYSRFSRGHKVTSFVGNGHRLEIPPTVPPFFADLITKCWADNAADRPTFSELVEELEKAFARRLPESNLSEELSTKESFRKTRNRSRGGSLTSELATNVFSNPTSPSIEGDLFESVLSIQGTATSSTLSNMASFTTATPSGTNSSEMTASPLLPPPPPTSEDEAEGYVVCDVCHSKTSTASSSKSSTANSSKSNTSGGITEVHITQKSTPSLVVEEAIANLEAYMSPLPQKSASRHNLVLSKELSNHQLDRGLLAKEESGSPSPRHYVAREESRHRIEKVMQALAAGGTIHEMKMEDAVAGKEGEKEDEEGAEGGAEEGVESEEYPKHLSKQQHSHNAIQKYYLSEFASPKM